jgi:hypothetical protein
MKKFLALSLSVLGLLTVTSLALASTADTIQPAETIIYDENVDVNGEIKTNSLRVGTPELGGVTYFNGTIINEGRTPVTFGDDVRIDGALFRGTTTDNKPLKVNDNLKVSGNLNVDKDVTVTGNLKVNGNIDVGDSYIASHWMHADGVFGIWVLRLPNRVGSPTSGYNCEPGNLFMDTTSGSTSLYGCDENSTWVKF